MDKEILKDRLQLLENFSEYIPNDRGSSSDLTPRLVYKQILMDIKNELTSVPPMLNRVSNPDTGIYVDGFNDGYRAALKIFLSEADRLYNASSDEYENGISDCVDLAKGLFMEEVSCTQY